MFQDQYHLYEDDKPFGLKRRETIKWKRGSNGDLTNLNEDLNMSSTYNRNLHISTSPSRQNFNNIDNDGYSELNTVSNRRNSSDAQYKVILNST